MRIYAKPLRFTAFVILFITLFIIGCKKNVQEEEIIPTKTQLWLKKLSDDLSSADSIRQFSFSLEYMRLHEEDIEEGLTIFAPLNDIAPLPSKSKGKGQISILESPVVTIKDSILKEYIAKGIYKLADLEDGKTITNLNGRALQISKNGEEISIGGLLISGEEIISDNERTVYAVKTVFP